MVLGSKMLTLLGSSGLVPGSSGLVTLDLQKGGSVSRSFNVQLFDGLAASEKPRIFGICATETSRILSSSLYCHRPTCLKTQSSCFYVVSSKKPML